MESIYCINDLVKSTCWKNVEVAFRGHILVDEKGWFEGYIKKVGYVHADYIFGIYHPGEILDLYLCSSTNPQIFHGKLDKKLFRGSLKFLGDTSSDYEHTISFSTGKISEEGLRSKIAFAKSKISKNCDEFYKKAYESREELDKVLVKTYVGAPFTSEDKEMARDINNKKRETRHMLRKMNTRGGR